MTNDKIKKITKTKNKLKKKYEFQFPINKNDEWKNKKNYKNKK